MLRSMRMSLEDRLAQCRLYGIKVERAGAYVRVLNVAGVGPCAVSGRIAVDELLQDAVHRVRNGQRPLPLVYEDQLPDNISRAEYHKFFARSFLCDGVRVGYYQPTEE